MVSQGFARSGAASAEPAERTVTSPQDVLVRRLDWARLAGPLERASAATARLDQALTGHPLAAAWRHRSRLQAAEKAAQADGLKADMDRLVALLLGLPVEQHRDSFGAEARALRLLRLLLTLYGEPGVPDGSPGDLDDQALRADTKDVLDALRSVAGTGSTLVDIGLGVLGLAMRGEVSRGALVAALPRQLRRRRFVTQDLPALTALPIVPEHPDPTRWIATWLTRMEEAAKGGLDLLQTLTLQWDLWHRALGKRRADSRHEEALALALTLPALAPVHLRRHLSRTRPITMRGAGKICAELAELGILVEITDRRNWHLYVPSDLAALTDTLIPRESRLPLDRVVPRAAGYDRSRPLSDVRLERLPPLVVDFSQLFRDVDAASGKALGAAERGLDFLQEFRERHLRETLSDLDGPSPWDDPDVEEGA